MNDRIEIGSDNIFKDLDYDNPEERLAKSELARKISLIVDASSSLKQASELVGLSTYEMCLICGGIVSNFSIEKLTEILNKIK